VASEKELARRARAALIGHLHACQCLYPLKRYATSTEHAETCPAHLTTFIRPTEQLDENVMMIGGAITARPFSLVMTTMGWRGRCLQCELVVERTTVALIARAFAEHKHGVASAEASP